MVLKKQENKGMTKNEVIFTVSTLFFIFIFAVFNMLKAQVLARDIQRKNDLKHIATALGDYLKDGYLYPVSENGKIYSCLGENRVRACEWGKDAIESSTSAYIKPLPEDPLAPGKKHSYFYVSNTRDFHLYSHLEGDDVEVNKRLEERKIMCGIFVCNFGVTSSNDFPVEKELPLNSR